MLAPGVRVDNKYTIEGTLGSGGTAFVFSATQEDLQRLVAIKVIRRELIEHPDAMARLMNEARTIAQIRGEHAAHVLDVGQLEDGCPYIVMEHLDGSDFAQLLEEHGPAPFERVIDWVLQASVAIAEAHSLGIIHRDLKPQNLYLANTPKGEPVVKVLDFGISTTTKSRLPMNGASTGEFKRVDGSPLYMSPEQMQALPEDLRSDIWGLGVLMFELLTGEVPFPGQTFDEICANALHTAPPLELITNAPKELVEVVGRCLQKEPEARFANVAEFARALEPLAGSDGKRCVNAIESISSGSAASGGAAVWSRKPSSAPRQSRSQLNDADTLSAPPRSPSNRRVIWLASIGAALIALSAWLLSIDRTPAEADGPEDVLEAATGAPQTTTPTPPPESLATQLPSSVHTAPAVSSVEAVGSDEDSSVRAEPGPPSEAPGHSAEQASTVARKIVPIVRHPAPRPSKPSRTKTTADIPSSRVGPKPARKEDPNWAWKRDSFGSRR